MKHQLDNIHTIEVSTMIAASFYAKLFEDKFTFAVER